MINADTRLQELGTAIMLWAKAHNEFVAVKRKSNNVLVRKPVQDVVLLRYREMKTAIDSYAEASGIKVERPTDPRDPAFV